MCACKYANFLMSYIPQPEKLWNTYSVKWLKRHQLHIKVECQHVRGSLFSVAELGTPILTLGEVVAINQRGEVMVTNGGCVSVFSPSGEASVMWLLWLTIGNLLSRQSSVYSVLMCTHHSCIIS